MGPHLIHSYFGPHRSTLLISHFCTGYGCAQHTDTTRFYASPYIITHNFSSIINHHTHLWEIASTGNHSLLLFSWECTAAVGLCSICCCVGYQQFSGCWEILFNFYAVVTSTHIHSTTYVLTTTCVLMPGCVFSLLSCCWHSRGSFTT